MTPMWKEAIKPLLGRLTDPSKIALREELARARCFDLRAVEPLLVQTSHELARGSTPHQRLSVRDPEAFSVDVGERVCFPAALAWLEWGDAAAFLRTDDFQTATLIARMHFRDDGGHERSHTSLLETVRLEDGIATITRIREPKIGDVSLAFMSLAALAVINSPAAKHEAQPPHRGMERDIAKASGAALPEIRHTIVTLGATHNAESGLRRSPHPKAYHFCRAHPRTRRGRTEHVRAHWRGDIAFGVRLPTYRV